MCAARVSRAFSGTDPGQKRVMVAGEGTNEVGSDANGTPSPGVLEALARRVVPIGWHVAERRRWKDIKKYQSGNHLSAEARTILGLLNDAREKNIGSVLVARDTDYKKTRAQEVLDGLNEAKRLWPDSPTIQDAVVGSPDPSLEAWVLAVNGVSNTKGIRDQALRHELLQTFQYDLDEKNTQKLVAMVEGAATQPAADAVGLKRWLKDAEKSLCGP